MKHRPTYRTLRKGVDANGMGLCLTPPDTKHEPAPDMHEQRRLATSIRTAHPFDTGPGHIYPKLRFPDILYTYVGQTYSHGL